MRHGQLRHERARSPQMVALGSVPREVLVSPTRGISRPSRPMLGAIPRLVEIDESLTTGRRRPGAQGSSRTKAIMVFHMANRPCDMDRVNGHRRRPAAFPSWKTSCQRSRPLKGRRLGRRRRWAASLQQLQNSPAARERDPHRRPRALRPSPKLARRRHVWQLRAPVKIPLFAGRDYRRRKSRGHSFRAAQALDPRTGSMARARACATAASRRMTVRHRPPTSGSAPTSR